VSSAQNLSFLSDDDEPEQQGGGITHSTSNSNIYGFTQHKDNDKRDVDKVSSWRRPSVGEDSRPPNRTTTVTPATTKSVTINSNPIMNSPRGLKKSVSHHSLSAFSSDREGRSIGDRPLAPLGRGIPPFRKAEGQTPPRSTSVSADDDSTNKLKKSQSMTSVYSVLEENR